MDGSLAAIKACKVEQTEFDKFSHSLQKERADSVFEDMKELFDATVKQFDDKVAYERSYIEKSFEKIILHQRIKMKIYK